jgi:hypothetical protein
MDYPRDVPLRVCPDAACRRLHKCLGGGPRQPCKRYYLSEDQVYDRLSAKLRALVAAHRRSGPRQRQPPSEEQIATRLAEIYRAFEARARQIATEQAADRERTSPAPPAIRQTSRSPS